MIDLFYQPTPNGKKVTILLEEAGMPYNVVPLTIGRGDQFTDDFLKIGPNNRMPAMVDTEPAGGWQPISGSSSPARSCVYHSPKGRQVPAPLTDSPGATSAIERAMWQMANQGPKSGEAAIPAGSATARATSSCAVTRFTDEVNRLYGVLNNRLSRPALDRRRGIHDRFPHDLLPLDHRLAGPGPGR